MNNNPRVIIDYELGDPSALEVLIRHVHNLHTYYKGELALEIMAYGPGLTSLMKTNIHSAQLAKLADMGITLIACQNTMQRMNVTKDQLLDATIYVPSGLGHIIDRQLTGWAYLKA